MPPDTNKMSTTTNSPLDELADLLLDSSSSRDDVALAALAILLQQLETGESPALTLLANAKLLDGITRCVKSPASAKVRATALALLVNLSASGGERACERLSSFDDARLFRSIIATMSAFVDAAASSPPVQLVDLTARSCMLLSNLTRDADRAARFAQLCESDLQLLRFTFGRVGRPESMPEHWPALLANLSQLESFRRQFIALKASEVESAFACMHSDSSVAWRRAMAAIVRNLCFDDGVHSWILNEARVLPVLLLPLAGPESFDDEDNASLPLELQYLPASTKRDSDARVRQLCLESLLQLCSSSPSRTCLRRYGAYLILRELHKVETDAECLYTCENIVDILIRDESDYDNCASLRELSIDDAKTLETVEGIAAEMMQTAREVTAERLKSSETGDA